jgi:hypothetical protein
MLKAEVRQKLKAVSVKVRKVSGMAKKEKGIHLTSVLSPRGEEGACER